MLNDCAGMKGTHSQYGLHSIACTGWTFKIFDSPTCAGNTVQYRKYPHPKLTLCIHDQIICQIICQMLFAQRFDQIFDELFDEKFEANLTEFAQMLQYLQCCI